MTKTNTERKWLAIAADTHREIAVEAARRGMTIGRLAVEWIRAGKQAEKSKRG